MFKRFDQNKIKIILRKVKTFLIFALAPIFTFFTAGVKPAYASVTEEVLLAAVAYLGNAVLSLSTRILYIAGLFFDESLKISILNFHKYVDLGAIQDAWVIIRDLSNMFFIFIMLYIAIATVLQLSSFNMKQMLGTVMLAALLINFSMVFAKVIIDSSNIIALEFYEKIVSEANDKGNSLSGIFAGGLNIQTVYKTEVDRTGKNTPQMSLMGVIIGTFGGTFFVLTTAFVFFTAAFIFIVRTIMLLGLIILSPLAFLSMALGPYGKGFSGEWWDRILKQSFLAPAYIFLLYIVARLVTDTGGLMNAVVGGQTYDKGLLSIVFLDTGAATESIGMVVYFAMLILMMKQCLAVAQSMGGEAAAMAMKAADWTKGKMQETVKGTASYTGRKIGGTAATLASNAIKKYAPSRTNSSVALALEKASSIGKNKEKIKAKADSIGKMAISDQAKAFSRASADVKKEHWSGMDADKRNKLKNELQKQAAAGSSSATEGLSAVAKLERGSPIMGGAGMSPKDQAAIILAEKDTASRSTKFAEAPEAVQKEVFKEMIVKDRLAVRTSDSVLFDKLVDNLDPEKKAETYLAMKPSDSKNIFFDKKTSGEVRRIMFEKMSDRDRADFAEGVGSDPGKEQIFKPLVEELTTEKQEKMTEAGKKAKRAADIEKFIDPSVNFGVVISTLTPKEIKEDIKDDVFTGPDANTRFDTMAKNMNGEQLEALFKRPGTGSELFFTHLATKIKEVETSNPSITRAEAKRKYFNDVAKNAKGAIWATGAGGGPIIDGFMDLV